MNDMDLYYLRWAVTVAQKARQHGNLPFGAVLVDKNGGLLLEAESTVITERDCTGHAETNLMRAATARYSPEILRTCTLYASTEPCPMCSGAIYWGAVGRVVFALGEDQLREMIGPDSEHDALVLSCREVFARGQHAVTVEGPADLPEAREVHNGFW